MHPRPFVSIIILAYNGGAFLAGLLASLEAQDYPRGRFEILVADNASRDGSRDIVQAWPGVRLLPFAENKGFAAGNNEAVKHAGGEALVFLNQDTVCHPSWLGELIAALYASPGVGAVASNMLLPGDAGFMNLSCPLPADLHLIDLSPLGYGARRVFKGADVVSPRIVSGCSFALRRETLDLLGELFDPGFWMYAEDTDLSLRLRNLGLELKATRSSVVHHLHASSVALGWRALTLARRALQNRVVAFYKNLSAAEFAVYYPVLLLGGWAKVFALPLPLRRKLLYVVPFGVFSAGCMLWALARLRRFSAKRRGILHRRMQRGGGRFALLAHMFHDPLKSPGS